MMTTMATADERATRHDVLFVRRVAGELEVHDGAESLWRGPADGPLGYGDTAMGTFRLAKFLARQARRGCDEHVVRLMAANLAKVERDEFSVEIGELRMWLELQHEFSAEELRARVRLAFGTMTE